MDPYEISPESGGIVCISMRGFWSTAVLHEFNIALDALIAQHQRSATNASPLRILVDGREQDVQSQEVIEALRQRASVRAGSGVRVAVVVATMLRKLQAERVSPNANRAVFFDESEARAWLRDG